MLLLGTHTLFTSPLCPAASTRRDSWSLYEHQKRFAICFWKKRKFEHECWTWFFYLSLQDYVPDNLESVAGFDAPMSPDSSYNDPVPEPDDFTKEPPTVPSQLHMAVLNVASESLPRPQHVVLKHLFVEKEQANCPVLVLSATNRFRSKYVTNLLYKPSAMQ